MTKAQRRAVRYARALGVDLPFDPLVKAKKRLAAKTKRKNLFRFILGPIAEPLYDTEKSPRIKIHEVKYFSNPRR